jgi:hypothetical protein
MLPIRLILILAFLTLLPSCVYIAVTAHEGSKVTITQEKPVNIPISAKVSADTSNSSQE